MNMNLMDGHCPIWDTPSANSNWGTPSANSDADDSFDLLVDSPRAGGKYLVDNFVLDELYALNERDKVKLTSWLDEQRTFGNSFPKITSVSIFEAQQRKELRIAERVDGILRYLESKSPLIGIDVQIYVFLPRSDTELKKDHLIYFDLLRHSESVNFDELMSLLNYLKERRYIEHRGLKNNPRGECSLTVEGRIRLEEIEKPNQASTKVFVAMWFDDSMDEVWEKGIRPAITEAGFEPVRIDRKEHMNKIDDEIIAEIRRSRFVVADFTHGKIDDNDLPIKKRGARGGVYYEAGFAQGLGIDVIFTCREDQIDDVHFDTRQYPHIRWSRSEELKEALKNRIPALYGNG